MVTHQAIETGVEVNGQTVMSFIDGVPSAFKDKTRDILAENGIENPDAEDWYPQQAWLDALSEIEEKVGESTLNSIGQTVPDNAEWPDHVESVVDGFDSIDEAYHMNHRGGRIGHYDAEVIDDETVRVECDNPYPCAFDTGIVEAVSRIFVESGIPQVREVGETCRSDGDDQCVYEVTW
jgi:hypothetical protein